MKLGLLFLLTLSLASTIQARADQRSASLVSFSNFLVNHQNTEVEQQIEEKKQELEQVLAEADYFTQEKNLPEARRLKKRAEALRKEIHDLENPPFDYSTVNPKIAALMKERKRLQEMDAEADRIEAEREKRRAANPPSALQLKTAKFLADAHETYLANAGKFASSEAARYRGIALQHVHASKVAESKRDNHLRIKEEALAAFNYEEANKYEKQAKQEREKAEAAYDDYVSKHMVQ